MQFNIYELEKIMLSRVEHEFFLKPRALVITIEHGYGFKYNIYIICFARKCNNDTPSELSTKSTSKKKKKKKKNTDYGVSYPDPRPQRDSYWNAFAETVRLVL